MNLKPHSAFLRRHNGAGDRLQAGVADSDLWGVRRRCLRSSTARPA
jgi:hypothetical protein